MEKINILSFNVKNIKTNNYYLTQEIVNNNIDICYITETWLAEEETQIVYDKFGSKFNVSNQNEFSISSERRGRPFGGKRWLINKKLKIGKHEYVNKDVSFTEFVNDDGTSKFLVIGVHLPFDDGTNSRISNFLSNLEIINSLVDEYSNLPVITIGDFNTDLNTNKRYSVKLAKFIEENKMTCMDYKFPNTAYTYRNGNFENRIDHVITNEIAGDFVIDCKILEHIENMSDHNPILSALLLNPINNNNNNEFNINDRKFYKFPWNEEKFVKEFQQGIKDKMSNFEYELRLNTLAIEMST
jgi:hypothetical protein